VTSALKTHCVHGHPFSPENTRIKIKRGRPSRECRICHARHKKEHLLRKEKPRKPTIAEKFWARVDKTDTCWNWRGERDGHGYGRLHLIGGKRTFAHRLSLTLHGIDIPKGLVIDHLCRNPLCVNPAHLRTVDIRTNTLVNSVAVTAINAAKTHCIRGHEFTAENTYVPPSKSPNGRTCRTCRTLADKARVPRHRGRKSLSSTICA
jgi:hypothetical protein